MSSMMDEYWWIDKVMLGVAKTVFLFIIFLTVKVIAFYITNLHLNKYIYIVVSLFLTVESHLIKIPCSHMSMKSP